MLVELTLLAFFLFLLYYHYDRSAGERSYAKRFQTPPELPFIGIGHQFLNPLECLKRTTDMHLKYGPNVITHLGPIRLLTIGEPQLLECILGSTKYIDKGSEYIFFNNWFGDGLLTSTGYKWKTHRKVITPTFHYKILEQFVNVFNKESDVLVEQLRKEVSKNSFEVYKYMSLCTMDIICETSMGVSLNLQQNQTNSAFYTSTKDMCDIVYHRCFNPFLRYDLFYRWSSMYRKEQKAVKILRTFSDDIIKMRKKEKEQSLKQIKEQSNEENEFNIKKRISFLDMLLECEIDGKPLSLQDIQDEVDTFIFEGHDTTAVAISFALYCLSKNQEVQEKCYQEIIGILGTDKSTKPTHTDLMEMKYLEMTIKEVLRLYPSVPGYSRKLKEDVVFEDIIIPNGSEIVVVPYTIHRNPKLYPNPEEFIPERFTLEECTKRHPYAYLPFSAGPRNCIGQKFAMLEMKSTISKVLRHYRLLPTIPEYEPQIISKVTIQSANGINVRIEERL